jgi:hypothetical protein
VETDVCLDYEGEVDGEPGLLADGSSPHHHWERDAPCTPDLPRSARQTVFQSMLQLPYQDIDLPKMNQVPPGHPLVEDSPPVHALAAKTSLGCSQLLEPTTVLPRASIEVFTEINNSPKRELVSTTTDVQHGGIQTVKNGYNDERQRQMSHDSAVALHIYRDTPERKEIVKTHAPTEPITSDTPQTDEISSTASSCGDETLSMSEVSMDDTETDCVLQLKEETLDRLMVCFYEIFAASGVSKCTGEGSSAPRGSSTQVDVAGQSQRRSGAASRKRKLDDRPTEGNGDEEDDRTDKKRQRDPDGTDRTSSDSEKRLACPYFKRNPSRFQSSRACSGPGWLSVHRLKYDQTDPLFLRTVH